MQLMQVQVYVTPLLQCISTFTASLKPCFLACAQIFVATTKIWAWARKRGACSAVGRTTML